MIFEVTASPTYLNGDNNKLKIGNWLNRECQIRPNPLIYLADDYGHDTGAPEISSHSIPSRPQPPLSSRYTGLFPQSLESRAFPVFPNPNKTLDKHVVNSIHYRRRKPVMRGNGHDLSLSISQEPPSSEHHLNAGRSNMQTANVRPRLMPLLTVQHLFPLIEGC